MNGKESDRITALEVGQQYISKEVGEVRKDVKKMLTNDFPHMREALETNKTDLQAKISENSSELKVLAVKLAALVGLVAFVATILGERVVNTLF